MSSNNNSMSPEMMFGILVLAVLFYVFMFLAALFAFAAIVLTGCAFAAWNEPRTLAGETLYPHEARAYVGRGVIGAIALPVFVVFCGSVFQYNLNEITEHGWLLIILGGYSIGSLGIEIAIQQEREKAEAAAALQQEILPALPPQQPAPKPVHREEQQAFEFETWDDEEIIK